MRERNNAIDIFRYLCAIMVVAIHTQPFMELSTKLSYVFSEIIPRIAVPFFFIVAGYFYINKLDAKKPIFLSYIKRLLKIYVFWSCVYFAIDFIHWGHISIKGFVFHCVLSFFINGSHYHFWFFPALIFAVCATTLVYKLKLKKVLLPMSIILYTIGCLGCSYRSIGLKIPGLSMLFSWDHFTLIRRNVFMAFPYFAAGSLAAKAASFIKKKNASDRAVSLVLSGAICCWLLEIMIVILFQLQENIIITFGLYLLTVTVMAVLLHYPMPKAHKTSQKCHILANLTYYVHPLVITLLTFAAKAIGGVVIPETILFILVVAATLVIGMAYSHYKMRRQ